MTFYLAEFTHKETQKKFYKFGVTNRSFEWRFNPNLYKEDRYKYNEFDIKCIGSIECNEKQSSKIENYFLKKYPKNFYLENYLNKPYSYYSNGFTGITETVILDDLELSKVKDVMKKIKETLSNLKP